MQRVGALFAMAIVGLIGLAGVGLMLWGGFVGAIVYEDGSTPGEISLPPDQTGVALADPMLPEQDAALDSLSSASSSAKPARWLRR